MGATELSPTVTAASGLGATPVSAALASIVGVPLSLGGVAASNLALSVALASRPRDASGADSISAHPATSADESASALQIR
jgi:hypothetical protein